MIANDARVRRLPLPAFAQTLAESISAADRMASARDVFERTPPFTEQVARSEARARAAAGGRRPGVRAGVAAAPRGTPQRQAPVIQTQIILAVVGAVVMLVVGSSLARAFGIVGAAGLVRYRAKIDDPKDAGVMLSTLAVGLAAASASGCSAVFATLFILAVLWVVESFEPKATQLFTLKVKAKDPAASSRSSTSC